MLSIGSIGGQRPSFSCTELDRGYEKSAGQERLKAGAISGRRALLELEGSNYAGEEKRSKRDRDQVTMVILQELAHVRYH